MVYDLTTDTVIMFAIFIIVVFVLYKLFRILLKSAAAAIAGFLFPYIVQYLKLPLDIAVNNQTSLEFAAMAVGIYLVYEFFHFIKYFLQILAWPIKLLGRKRCTSS
ncbi:MAG: hypothetical protein PHU12_01620 [Candidatus Aenigmarchaeota archaeon]|nr:hypothetical protein [Candidatus Aenigmarchaeota archaeon]